MTSTPRSGGLSFGASRMVQWLVGLLMGLTTLPVLAQTTADLSIRQSISQQKPTLGDVVSYTVAVRNAAGSATATNVKVQNSLPTGGVAYVFGSASVLRGAGTYAPETGVFSISAIAPGDSAVLTLRATVLGRGVYFNIAEVVAADQADSDSQVANQILAEDDYDAVCFSVPILFYAGDEYTVTIPSGYDEIVWYRNDQPISTSALSTSLAQVNANGSLTFKSPGVYRFVTLRGGCPSTNCCDIEVIPGRYGSLGNYVFLDVNRNGLQDDGPTGIDGVTVYLYDPTGTTRLGSTVTAGGGRYLFNNLTDGSYRIQFVAPSNATLSFTPADAPSSPADSLDSDADANGFTRVYTIDTSRPETDTARNNPNVDAGFIRQPVLASLGDRVFVDANRDGRQGPADQERGLPGVVVNLLNNGNVVASDTTDANGGYLFTGLTPGVPYSLSFATPFGYQSTTADVDDDATDSDLLAGGVTAPVTLTAGENNTTLDAGFFRPGASLGDRVFADVNRDGRQGPADQEPGIAGVVVSLLRDGNVIASNTTDENGIYLFTDLIPGVPYSLSFSTPVGYSATVANAGDDTADSDLLAGNVTDPITLTAGENNTTIDVGFLVIPASFSSRVFVDANRDGQQGPPGREPGIAGVVVTLYSGEVPIASDTTDVNGVFSFTGLAPGVPYSLSYTTPRGYSVTVANRGDDATDSDLPVSGVTPPITLKAGENNTHIDAGFYVPSASLGNRVFVDVNQDGQQGPLEEEPGLPGVVVSLIRNGRVVVSDTTDAYGGFLFANLEPGVPYSLRFTAPDGYTATVADAGDDATDSDLLTGNVTDPITLTAGENNTTLDAGFLAPRVSFSMVVAVNAAVCDPATNAYRATATVTLVNAPAGSLTITNNGVVVATVSVSAGQTSALVSLTGLSGSAPATHTVVASLAGLTASAAYEAPRSCTNCGTIALLPASLIPGQVGAAYSQTLTASGGTAPYTYAVVGSLPTGLRFDTDTGILSGTPTVTGTTAFTVVVTDSRACTATAAYTLTIGLTPSMALSIFDPAICNPVTNVYSTTGTVSLVGVPAGIVTITDNGVVAATVPVTAGQTSVLFNLTGLSGTTPTTHTLVASIGSLTATGTYTAPPSCTTCGTIAVTPSNLPGTLVGAVYSQTVTASGGVAPYTYAVLGSLPTGLSFNGTTGVLSGTPTLATTTSFTVLVTDSRSCTATAAYSLTVGQTPSIALFVEPAVCNPATNTYRATATVSLVGASAGTLTVTDNGVVVAMLGVTAGQTSAQVSLTGLSGTSPAARTVVATLATLTASVTYTVPASCTTCSTLALAPASLSTGQVGVAYSQPLTASGGVAPYTYVVVGSLPTGLRFNAATGVLSGTPTVAGTTAFTVLVSDSRSCTGEASYNLTVEPVEPNCPTNFNLVTSADATICNGETYNLTATTTVGEATIRWFLTPYDGTAIATTRSGQSLTVNPTTTTVYYAEAFTSDGCVSARKPVVVTVTTVPSPVVSGNVRNTCPATTVDLTAIRIENQASGLTYEWYMSLIRSEATRVTDLTAVGAGKYYLFARSGRCYSNPTVLTVEIVDCNCPNVAGVNVGPSLSICAGATVPLRAVLSGAATSVTWSTNGTGTFTSPNSLATAYVPSAADSAAGRVELTATTNDPDGAGGLCRAATSSLVLTIKPRPVALDVASDDTLICLGSSTKLVGFAPGARINWYDPDGRLIGTTQNGGKLTVTPARAGAVVYSAEAVSTEGCVSATRSTVTVTVGTCGADLAVVKQILTPGPYQVGQNVTYSITVSNNGPITATNVNVRDLLPATLTYVSATPAGQYAAGTGNWTVGTLPAGSNRNLLIEATIRAAGSITNTAVVTGAENDLGVSRNDTSAVTIQATDAPVGPCAVEAPFLTCAQTSLCAGDETTLTATGCAGGTVRWSNEQTGATVTVKPGVTTTYSAICQVGTCVSGASNAIAVTVNNPQVPTLTANVDRTCPGGDVILTASGCAGGTYQWAGRTETSASITVNPTSRTTYTVQCRMGGCVSGAATKTIDMSTNLPTPTVVCSTTIACPGEDVTLTVQGCSGTPVWSTGATTGSIVVRPTVGNNSYTVRCRSGACSSPESPAYVINVVEPAIPNVMVSADTICAGGAVTLTATGCEGTVKWSNGQTGATVTVTPDATISYSAQCRVRSCLSSPSNAVTVTVLTPSIPLISASSGTVCSGESLTLTAQGCAGTVKWSNGQTGASLILRPAETTTYFATCVVGACESFPSNRVAVAVGTSGTVAPRITASTLAVCSGGVVTLSATGCSGTVQWSDGQTGAVVSVTATPTNREFYAVCKAGAGCGSGRSNIVALTVTPTPTPTVVCSTTALCPGEDVTLLVENCQGTPTWSTGQTGRSIVVKPAVTTSYTVFCREGVCTSGTSPAYTITVMPVARPTITASATAVMPGETVTLTATGCAGTVYWSTNGVDGRNTGASITVRPEAIETYSAQCQVRSCLSEPSNSIVVNAGGCAADAGTLVATVATVCAGAPAAGTLAANTVVVAARANGDLVQPAGYSVAYVLTKGSGLIIQQMGTLPQFTVAGDAADYTIHTLVYDARPTSLNYLDLSGLVLGTSAGADVAKLIADRNVCADLDLDGAKIAVRRVTPPVLAVDQSVVCYGTNVTLTAGGCDGGIINWSDGSIGRTITRPVLSDLRLTATCTVDGCTSELSSAVNVAVRVPGVPTIASDRSVVCAGESATLTAVGCEGGTFVWSTGRTGSTLTVSPMVDTPYRVRCQVGNCEGAWSPYTTIQSGAPAAPTILIAGSSQFGTSTLTSATVCYSTPVTLTAEGCPAGAYVVWSNDQTGTSITVSLVSSSTYTARCATLTNCKSAPSNALTLTVLPKVPTPVTVDKTNACPFNTVDLTTAVSSRPATTGGMFEYYTSATLAAAAKVANPSAVGTGTYYVAERTTNGCYGLPGVIHVQINACSEQVPCNTVGAATASAGADASICATKTYRLNGTIGGSATRAQWTTSGTGTFDDPFSPTATYTASIGDVMTGRVTLRLTASTSQAACPSVADEIELTINGARTVPVVRITGATQFCNGDSVRLEASSTGTGYLWSNGATTRGITVRQSGTYSVQVLDPNGCSSVKSDDVGVTVTGPVAAPLVTNLRNDCPARVVNLTRAVTAPTAGSTYEYRTGASATANLITRPDSVGAGTYYIFEKTAIGCVSAPARVEVSVFGCATDQSVADLSLTKTADRPVVRVGEIVTYTIRVTNNGSHTVRNIDVRDALPAGLERVGGSTPGYTVSNGVVSKRIDSLRAGQSAQFAFATTVRTTGAIVNTAAITAADRRDPNLANNTASATVQSSAPVGNGVLGVAKAVVGTPTSEGDSLIRVTYRFTLTNYGNETLRYVQLTDDLAYAFRPNSVESVTDQFDGAPVNSETLRFNRAFTGVGSHVNLLDSASYLAPGRSQSLLLNVTVKRTAGDTTRAFHNIANASAWDGAKTISDQSVDGGNADPDGDGNPTNNAGLTTFTLEPPARALLGVAKAVGAPTRVGEGVFDVPYTIRVENRGNVALKNVQVVDNLSQTFGRGALIVSNRIRVTADAGLVVDSAYTGQGLITNMLVDSLSTLPVGTSRNLTFTVRVDVKNADTLTFLNSARATARTADGTLASDQSTNGLNVDPDNDRDPGNNSRPTPVSLDSLMSGNSRIGIALAVRDTARQADGSYNVTYQIVVRNYGREELTGVAVSDTLAKVFNATTGASYTVVQAPVAISTGSALKLNANFDGNRDPWVVIGDSTSSLAAGKADSVLVTLNVRSDGSTTTFLNSAMAQAYWGADKVWDISTNGLVADLNGNGDPTDPNEGEATPLSLPLNQTTLFIPQGFSPNGDGINDRFVIRGLNGLTVSLEVYNRWGHMVYQNTDYQNDWDGRPNVGLLVGANANGLPDGTYYYVIRTSDGQRFIRYLTISR